MPYSDRVDCQIAYTSLSFNCSWKCKPEISWFAHISTTFFISEQSILDPLFTALHHILEPFKMENATPSGYPSGGWTRIKICRCTGLENAGLDPGFLQFMRHSGRYKLANFRQIRYNWGELRKQFGFGFYHIFGFCIEPRTSRTNWQPFKSASSNFGRISPAEMAMQNMCIRGTIDPHNNQPEKRNWPDSWAYACACASKKLRRCPNNQFLPFGAKSQTKRKIWRKKSVTIGAWQRRRRRRRAHLAADQTTWSRGLRRSSPPPYGWPAPPVDLRGPEPPALWPLLCRLLGTLLQTWTGPCQQRIPKLWWHTANTRYPAACTNSHRPSRLLLSLLSCSKEWPAIFAFYWKMNCAFTFDPFFYIKKSCAFQFKNKIIVTAATPVTPKLPRPLLQGKSSDLSQLGEHRLHRPLRATCDIWRTLRLTESSGFRTHSPSRDLWAGAPQLGVRGGGRWGIQQGLGEVRLDHRQEGVVPERATHHTESDARDLLRSQDGQILRYNLVRSQQKCFLKLDQFWLLERSRGGGPKCNTTLKKLEAEWTHFWKDFWPVFTTFGQIFYF